MLYRFKAECPRCHKVSDVSSAQPSPYVRCGNCLMDDIEIVTMVLTRIREEKLHPDSALAILKRTDR